MKKLLNKKKKMMIIKLEKNSDNIEEENWRGRKDLRKWELRRKNKYEKKKEISAKKLLLVKLNPLIKTLPSIRGFMTMLRGWKQVILTAKTTIFMISLCLQKGTIFTQGW